MAGDLLKDIRTVLGEGVTIPFDSVLKCPRISIGDHTRINGAVTIRGQENCEIGKYCAFGYDIHILTTSHNMNHANIQVAMHRHHGFVGLEESKGVVKIGNNVWLGDNVTILAGVTIGDGAVVGAGSVVTKDIKPFEIAYGVPAKAAKKRFAENVIKQLLGISWWDWSEEKIKRNERFFNTDLAQHGDLDLNKIIVE